MAVTAESIKAFFPEFARVDSTTVTKWLTYAQGHHNANQWGAKSDDGLTWLTAHFLAVYTPECETDKVGPGPLTSSREGQVAASWSPLTVPKIFTKNDLGTTKYGRRYLSMVDTLFVTRCT